MRMALRARYVALGALALVAAARVSVAGTDGIDDFVQERAKSIAWAMELVHALVVGFLALGILAAAGLIIHAFLNFREWVDSYRSGATLREIVDEIRNRDIAHDTLTRAGRHALAARIRDSAGQPGGGRGPHAQQPRHPSLPPSPGADEPHPARFGFALRTRRIDGWGVLVIVLGTLLGFSAILAAFVILQ